MKNNTYFVLLTVLLLCVGTVHAAGDDPADLPGSQKKWHKGTLTFDGPQASETANTFTDYRLDVTFTQGSRVITVPGYFAADGLAHETSATSGNKWRVHFNAPTTGTWTYAVAFKAGNNVATQGGGSSAGFMDGQSGTILVGDTDKVGKDFRGKGMLLHESGHHLRFSNGEYFLKGGVDSPEDFLGFADFDNTYTQNGGSLHKYAGHVGDWKTGDPTWQGGKGKGIIGVINYISDTKGLNSMYFLTYNADGGDGKNVWPWTGPTNKEVFDVSKLAQWEVLFQHMMEKGVLMHVVLQETENNKAIANGDTDHIKKLYLRELIARFGHNNALVWNLGEEATISNAQIKSMASYVRQTDPYNHPIVIHTVPGNDAVYDGLIGYENFNGPSLQLHWYDAHEKTLKWLEKSKAAGKPWAVFVDEITFWACGVPPDGQTCRPVADWDNKYPANNPDYNQDDVRKEALWGNLMAGGAGTEWYLGCCMKWNGQDVGDVKSENLRSHDGWWNQVRFATNFFKENTPFWEMESCDDQLNSAEGYCISKPGQVYVVYVTKKGDPNVYLEPGSYTLSWYNPETGQQVGSDSTVSVATAGYRRLGTSPAPDDAVALVTTGFIPPAPGSGCSGPGCTDGGIDIEDGLDDGELPLPPPPLPPPPGTPIDPNRLQPYIVPDGGSFTGSTLVTLTSREGADIHYTVDGSEPTLASPRYTAPFTITQTGTVRAKAYVLGEGTLPPEQETAQTVFGFSNGVAAIEAEHYAEQTLDELTSWVTIATNSVLADDLIRDHFKNFAADASGGEYLMALPDRYESTADSSPDGYNCFTGNQGGFPLGSFACNGGEIAVLTYYVDFPAAGRYYLWLRALGRGAEDNGIHAGIDDTWPVSLKQMQWCNPGIWKWRSGKRTGASHCGDNTDLIYFDIPDAGVHKVHLSLREDGFRVDKLLITDKSYADGFRPPADTAFGQGETLTSGTVGGGTGSSAPIVLEESEVTSAFFIISGSGGGCVGTDCGGGTTDPTCFDGIQNGGETGVDCGGSCAATCGGLSVASFTLVDANTNGPMAGFANPILPGSTVHLGDLSSKPLTIQATTSGGAKSVYFHVNGKFNKAENERPWSVNGDFGTDAIAWNPGTGTYTVTATPYPELLGKGEQGRAGTITVIFGGNGAPTVDGPAGGGGNTGGGTGPNDCGAGQEWNPATNSCVGTGGSGGSGRLILYDADADRPIPGYNPIPNGATISFGSLPTRNLNVVADIDAGSVKFLLNGEKFRVESFKPFALAGDNVFGDYHAWTPGPGKYTISAVPHPLKYALGSAGTPETVTVTFVEGAGGGTGVTPRVNSFTLIDANTNRPVPGFDPIRDGATVDLNDHSEISVRANVQNAKSVQFDVNNQLGFRVENAAPFALAGDSNGNYFEWEVGVGDQVVTATPYSGVNKGGTRGSPSSARFTVTRGGGSTGGSTGSGGGAGRVTSLEIVDANTDKPLPAVRQVGGAIVLAKADLPINVVAHTEGSVKSVEFSVNNVFFRLENFAPWALAGDASGDYHNWNPQPGSYIITAVPYSELRAAGEEGEPKTFTIKIE